MKKVIAFGHQVLDTAEIIHFVREGVSFKFLFRGTSVMSVINFQDSPENLQKLEDTIRVEMGVNPFQED